MKVVRFLSLSVLSGFCATSSLAQDANANVSPQKAANESRRVLNNFFFIVCFFFLCDFVFFTWLVTLSVSLPTKNTPLLLRFQSSSLEPALHHQRCRLPGLGCADLGKTCPSNKWFRLLGLSCNVVQNNPSFLVSFSLLF